MKVNCRNVLVCIALRRAPSQPPGPPESAQEKADAHKLPLGNGWTGRLVRYTSAHKVSRMIHRGLANTSTEPCAKQLRIELRAVRFSVGGVLREEESQ